MVCRQGRWPDDPSSGPQGKEINYQFSLSHLETSTVFWSQAFSIPWPRDISKQSPPVLANDSENYSRWPQPSPSALDPLSSLVAWISVPLASCLGNFPSAWTQQIDYLFGQSALLWTITAACAASQITLYGTCGQLSAVSHLPLQLPGCLLCLLRGHWEDSLPCP